MQIRKLVCLLFFSIFLSACGGIRLDVGLSVSEEKDAKLIRQNADAFPEVDLLAINDQIISYLNSHVEPNRSDRQKVERLRELLFDPEYLNIQYAGEHTRTAIETFESRSGNCLSVVSLYIAMARYLGIDAHYQTVAVRPRWDKRGGLFVLSQHINAVGRLPQRVEYVVDYTPEVVVQQLTASRVSDNRARALYFNNLGVEHLIQEDVSQSLIYFRNALWIAPDLSIAWSNMGAALNRSGDQVAAEYAFQKAFSMDDGNATAINNLAKLYTDQGRIEKARRYSSAIVKFNERNPYYHYALGNIAFSDGDMEAAEKHFKNAIKRKDVEPEFYGALSKTYRELGEEQKADDMIYLARYVLAASKQVYLPSQNKVRFIDEGSILRETSAGISVRANSSE